MISYYDKDGITIYNGDCLEIMKEIPDKSIDLVLTDPPYGFGKFAGDDVEFLVLVRNVFVEVKRVLKDGGWAFVFSGTGQFKNLVNVIDLEFQRLLAVYKPGAKVFPYRGWLLTLDVCALFTKGVPSPLFERHPYQHDCYVNKKWGKEGVEGHPTVKPLWVFKDLVSRSFENDVILDPFMGSGTTLVACKELGRRGVGIEISKEYCDIAVNRLKRTCYKPVLVQESLV